MLTLFLLERLDKVRVLSDTLILGIRNQLSGINVSKVKISQLSPNLYESKNMTLRELIFLIDLYES